MGGELKAVSSESLDDLLADQLIQLVMKADNVEASQIQELFRNLSGLERQDRAQGTSAEPVTQVTVRIAEDSRYRAGVGIMLLNAESKVFVGKRIATAGDAWQMPQGGIEDGEDAWTAARRELREEIGTDNVEMLAESKGWLRYELPSELVGKVWEGRWQGQQQKWFAARFRGSDSEISITTEHPEFSAWLWVPAAQLPKLIISFKRKLYLDVLRQFRLTYASQRDANRGP